MDKERIKSADLMLAGLVGLVALSVCGGFKTVQDSIGDQNDLRSIPRELLLKGEGWEATTMMKNIIDVRGRNRAGQLRGTRDIAQLCEGKVLSVAEVGGEIEIVVTDDSCVR